MNLHEDLDSYWIHFNKIPCIDAFEESSLMATCEQRYVAVFLLDKLRTNQQTAAVETCSSLIHWPTQWDNNGHGTRALAWFSRRISLCSFKKREWYVHRHRTNSKQWVSTLRMNLLIWDCSVSNTILGHNFLCSREQWYGKIHFWTMIALKIELSNFQQNLHYQLHWGHDMVTLPLQCKSCTGC